LVRPLAVIIAAVLLQDVVERRRIVVVSAAGDVVGAVVGLVGQLMLLEVAFRGKGAVAFVTLERTFLEERKRQEFIR
jgi:hypothetical protein